MQLSFLSSHVWLSLPLLLLLLVWHVCLTLVFMPAWQRLKCSCQWHFVLLSRWAFVWWVDAWRAFVNRPYVQSVFVHTRNVHVGIPTLTCVHACACIYDIHMEMFSYCWSCCVWDNSECKLERERQGECMGECVCLCGVFSMSVLLKIVRHVAVVCI